MGRLAAGVTIEEARREIESLGGRLAAEYPATHAQLQPQVLPYTRALTGMDSPDARVGVLVTQILAFLLLTLACGNVGVLVLARVASRTGEIAIRTALGASRLRILSQLFTESLLLAVLAAGVGLLILQAVATGPDYLLDGLPFWIDFEVSLRTTLLALSLAAASAVIAGVVPALKATGKRVHASMQGAAGGGSGIRFGKGYSVLIVGEVAVALWLLAVGAAMLPVAASRPVAVGIQTDQYLFAALRLPRLDQAAGAGESGHRDIDRRVAVAHDELVERLAAEPGVGPVAIADALPGMSHDRPYVQVDGVARDPRAPAPAWPVNVARVDVGFFEALGQPVLSGRGFNAGDLGEDRSAVIVNTSFVERVLGGRNPLGRRIRYWSPGQEPGPWSHEIVGVVGPLGMNALNPEVDQGLYHVVAPGELHPVSFAVRVGSDPERFTNRLRSIVTAIDPNALVQNPVALSDVPHADRRVIVLWTYLVTALAVIALVLSAACLYALVSFTVSRRTRECAIRAALGAQPANIVSQIGKRVFLQLSVGTVIGSALSALMLSDAHFEGAIFRAANWPVTVGLLALFVMAVGLLACVQPALRAIRIRPAEVLKG
jgi:predicted permease